MRDVSWHSGGKLILLACMWASKVCISRGWHLEICSAIKVIDESLFQLSSSFSWCHTTVLYLGWDGWIRRILIGGELERSVS